MKKLSIILLFIASAFSANSQDFLGYNYSNYQTAGGMVFNPASIADSRYRANISKTKKPSKNMVKKAKMEW